MEAIRTFWIITTPPNPKFADFHDRQPVILDKSEYDEWLKAQLPPLHLLRTFPQEKMLIAKVADAPTPKPKAKKQKDTDSEMPGLFDGMGDNA